MKIKITAASTEYSKFKVVEVNSIDEVIKRLRTDRELQNSIINEELSWITKGLIPSEFIIIFPLIGSEYYVEIQMCDWYL